MRTILFLLLMQSAAFSAVCAPVVMPELKGLESLQPGAVIEFRYKSEVHERGKIIQGKFLSYADGLVMEYLENGEVNYGTFPLANIIGRPTLTLDNARVKSIQRGLEWAQVFAEKNLATRYNLAELMILQKFFFEYGILADAHEMQRTMSFKISVRSKAEEFRKRGEFPARFEDWYLKIETVPVP